MRVKREKINKKDVLKRIIIVAIALIIVIAVLKLAPNYKVEDEGLSVIINNRKVNLKKDIYIDENDVIYLSMQDIQNFFDNEVYIQKDKNMLITTYDKHIATIEIGSKEMYVNGIKTDINATVIEKNEITYIPFSEMTLVYDVEINHAKEEENIVIDSYSREQKKSKVLKNTSIKSQEKNLSRTIDKIKKGDEVVVISQSEEGWSKVRSNDGNIGYVKTSKIDTPYYVRENMEDGEPKEKVSILFDYYSDYGVAPNRTGTTYEGINTVSPAFFSLVKLGKGELVDKVGNEGEEYMEWAKSNNYDIWAMVQNDGMIETTSEILNDYDLRAALIERIVNYALKYSLNGINIDFENMYEADKDEFSRFIIELYPRLKKYGIVLSVDVTAPDGSENWSLCYDRPVIAKNCDYILFMAYDQNGDSKLGTSAGYDWVELSLDKFISEKREGIDSEKIILGIPFYTRLWKETSDGKYESTIVNMKNIDNVLPNGVEKKWDDKLKQNYVEFVYRGVNCKMWIEDIDSISCKLDLVNSKNLGGVSFWAADREDEAVWNIVKEKISK